jgi:hypothetical protein
MVQYEVRPPIVNAVQWVGSNLAEITGLLGRLPTTITRQADDSLFIVSMARADLTVPLFNWVVRAPQSGTFDGYTPAEFDFAYKLFVGRT